MDFKINQIKNFTMSSWNNLLAELEGPLQNCLWNNLDYYLHIIKLRTSICCIS